MKRDELILQIREYLLSRRETLRRYLTGELSQIGTGDDEEALGDEAYFVIAESEAKELEFVTAAIDRMKAGRYGICEACERTITIARLNALPCTAYCIECQRRRELRRSGVTSRSSRRMNTGIVSL